MPRLRRWRLSFGVCLLSLGVAGLGTAQDLGDQADTDNAPKILTGNREKREKAKVRIREGDTWKKNPPVWSVPDPRGKEEKHPIVHPYAQNATVSPGPGVYPGGPNGAWGQPYYYTATGTGGSGPGLAGYQNYGQPDYGYGLFPSEGLAPAVYGQDSGYGLPQVGIPQHGYDSGLVPGPQMDPGYGLTPTPDYGNGSGFAPGYGPGVPQYGGTITPDYAAGYDAGGYAPAPAYGNFGGGNFGGGNFGSGGYGPGGQAAVPGGLPGNPYYYHFGPGYYRNQEAGHYRFPWFSYRRPWYFPGHPSYNRDTNAPW